MLCHTNSSSLATKRKNHLTINRVLNCQETNSKECALLKIGAKRLLGDVLLNLFWILIDTSLVPHSFSCKNLVPRGY